MGDGIKCKTTLFYIIFSSFIRIDLTSHLLYFLVLIILGYSCVDHLGAVGNDLPDETLLSQFNQSFPGQRSSHLQSLRNNAGSDELVSGNLFVQFVVGILIEKNQVVQLVPGLSFGPLLLLGLSTTSFLLLRRLSRSFRTPC